MQHVAHSEPPTHALSIAIVSQRSGHGYWMPTREGKARGRQESREVSIVDKGAKLVAALTHPPIPMRHVPVVTMKFDSRTAAYQTDVHLTHSTGRRATCREHTERWPGQGHPGHTVDTLCVV